MDRPDLYVVARILERLWREKEPMLRTRLQLAVGTNFDVLTKYLDWMQGRDLVAFVENDGHQKVLLTAEGRDSYHKLVIWINETVHGRFR